MMLNSFTGKVVLVTGGSSGIGEATAKHFAKLGASVAITGRDEQNLEKVSAECRSLGAPDVLTVEAEFSNLEDVKNVMDEVIKKFTKLDVLVNNVGATRLGCLSEISMSDFDYLFTINVKSMLYMTQLTMPHLVKTKGCVVNVSSRTSISHSSRTMLYGMTKVVVNHFTKTVALEYAPKGVRVNSINPAYVRTKFYRNHGMCDEDATKMFNNADDKHPLGRCGTAEEISEAVAFLASDASAYAFFVDGGMSLLV